MTEQTKTPLAGGASDGSGYIQFSNNSPASPSRQRRNLSFRYIDDAGNWQQSSVKGQTARALLALVIAGAQGVTALEISTWALRLSAYIHDLRKMGLNIQMIREEHLEGWHGRYILLTPVTLIESAGS